MNDARAMVGWQFWAAPAIFGLVSLGLGIGAIDGNLGIIFVFFLVLSAALILFRSRFRHFKKVNRDIEMRVAEIVEGAPEKVWPQKGVGWSLSYTGRDILVPFDLYDGNLREVNIVRVAFLPTALVAVHVEFTRGLGI
jgi:hypothetical protein